MKIKKKIQTFIILVLFLPLAGLQSKNQSDSITTPAQLMKNFRSGKFSGKPLDLNYYQEDVYQVLLRFSRFSGLSFLIDSDIKGVTVSGIIANIPWDHALYVFLKHTGLKAELEKGLIRISRDRSFFYKIRLIIALLALAILFVITYPFRKTLLLRSGKKKTAPKAVNFHPDYAHEIIKKLLDLMRKEKVYKNSDLNLNSLAGLLSVPAHQLSAMINKEMNRSVSRLINHYRVQEAKELLLNKPHVMNILKIALEAGFSNKAHFNKVFKTETGMSPRDFRKKSG